jgi:hypothetical protein
VLKEWFVHGDLTQKLTDQREWISIAIEKRCQFNKSDSDITYKKIMQETLRKGRFEIDSVRQMRRLLQKRRSFSIQNTTVNRNVLKENNNNNNNNNKTVI